MPYAYKWKCNEMVFDPYRYGAHSIWLFEAIWKRVLSAHMIYFVSDDKRQAKWSNSQATFHTFYVLHIPIYTAVWLCS